MSTKLITITAILLGVIIIALTASYFAFPDQAKPEPEQSLPWVDGALTQPLPKNASQTRLSLPYNIEDMMPDGAPITGFGTHIGQHAEGMDHSWIAVRKGESARAWGDAKVTGIQKIFSSQDGDEYMIYLDYGDGLICSFGEVSQPLVKQGQQLKFRDLVGQINDFHGFNASEVEIYCEDANRSDTVLQSASGHQGGFAVSPFDYLNNKDKEALVATYTQKVINAAQAGKDYGQSWYLAEPNLTNKILVHEKDKVTGEWFLVNKKWNKKDPSLVVFLPQAARLRSESADLSIGSLWLDGSYEVTYQAGLAQITIKDKHQTYYALAQVTEGVGKDHAGETKAQMKFELSQSPISSFSENALTYQERGIYNPRHDAWKLGNWVNYQ